MFRTHSLRYRVALFYALFGAGLSILLSAAVFLAVKQIGHQRMDQILRTELDAHARPSGFVAPNTVSIKGYAHVSGTAGENIPSEIRNLAPGHYNITIGETDYRVLIADRQNVRYYMLFDTEDQHLAEARFLRYVAMFALFMTLGSSAVGAWLAGRVTAPVTRLAEQVGKAEPGDMDIPLGNLSDDDEVGELARAFDRYLRRLRDFVERENYFTADVSHELRTPLAIMLGTVEILEQDESLSAKQKERVARIRRAAQDMIDLTAALLLMGREPQSATDELTLRIADIAQACVEKHRHLIGGRPIEMTMEVDAEPRLIVERPLLEIVIGNLIRNALFNTKAGAVLLRLEADRLIVRDTGVGMGPEELARALDRYYKGPTSAGSGVGLSLVKRICDRYGWRISLDSREGQGTTAEIHFGLRQDMSLSSVSAVPQTKTSLSG